MVKYSKTLILAKFIKTLLHLFVCLFLPFIFSPSSLSFSLYPSTFSTNIIMKFTLGRTILNKLKERKERKKRIAEFKSRVEHSSKTRHGITCARFMIAKVLHLWTQMVTCSPTACGKCHYRRISIGGEIMAVDQVKDEDSNKSINYHNNNHEEIDEGSDLILKVCLLGDYEIGKTSFMNSYVGVEGEQNGIQCAGVNTKDKVLNVRGAKILFSIWDVQGSRFDKHVPRSCKDAVAILFMFDLTSRRTLNNVIDWYRRARKWNVRALPILLGTKFDEFTELPLQMQGMIIHQARAYAKVMNATLFFSSSKHNINVIKIFKFITAQVFNLPWTVERNLTLGEPIIDF
ncbi:hypothetical protein LUZ60_005523 [Juncus effusus]|nr:hypothetical protein LUZ60_005523 [Juncus effusus]